MRFVNYTTNRSLTDACDIANYIAMNPDSKMYKALIAKNDFRSDWRTPFSFIPESFDQDRRTYPVLIYRPLNPFTRAIAMTKKNEPGIFFNTYKLNDKTPVAYLVGTLLHEWSHKLGFSHGSNWKTREKCERSVPYFLSENVLEFL